MLKVWTDARGPHVGRRDRPRARTGRLGRGAGWRLRPRPVAETANHHLSASAPGYSARTDRTGTASRPSGRRRSSTCRNSMAINSRRRAPGATSPFKPARTIRWSAFHAVRELARLSYGATQFRWVQAGFLPQAPSDETPRNLMGFKDGTNNPPQRPGRTSPLTAPGTSTTSSGSATRGRIGCAAAAI